MIARLFLAEWRMVLRDGRGLVLLVAGAVLLLGSVWTSAGTDAREREHRSAAVGEARRAWEERGADNPHSRAHYGDFVFRPSGPLAGLDPGLQAVTGRVLFVEGHRQNPSMHRPQFAASTLLRFERLDPAAALQLLAPLVLVLAGFASVSGDRETGRLRLMLVQGVRGPALLLSRALTLWSMGAAMCLLVVGGHLLSGTGAGAGRTFAFLLLHLALLWVVSCIVVAVSSACRRSGTAVSVLLGIWVLAGLVLPRLASLAAQSLEPLPTREAFEAAMREDREAGLDGHDAADTRRAVVVQRVLSEYGVEREEDLPINLDGIVMQADEEFGNQVWDEHFGRLERVLRRQSARMDQFLLLDPLALTDRLSMALAGTDLRAELDFLRQSEDYRRDLLRVLNHEHAHGGSRTGEWSWKAPGEFFASLEPFQHRERSLATSLSGRGLALLAMVGWVVLATSGLLLRGARLGRGGVL